MEEDEGEKVTEKEREREKRKEEVRETEYIVAHRQITKSLSWVSREKLRSGREQ